MLRAQGIGGPRPINLPGGNLTQYGQGVQAQAAEGLGAAARREVDRERTNAQVQQSNKAGGAAIGSVVGGIAGSFFGPIGTMIGSAAGGMLGSALF